METGPWTGFYYKSLLLSVWTKTYNPVKAGRVVVYISSSCDQMSMLLGKERLMQVILTRYEYMLPSSLPCTGSGEVGLSKTTVKNSNFNKAGTATCNIPDRM